MRSVRVRLVAAAALTVAVVAALSAAATGTGQAASSRYEAESATLSQATVATNHTGYSGAGFVDYTNVTGGYVQFAVTLAQSGTASLIFRYANGSSTNRPMTVAVDGTAVASAVAFNGTGSWDAWKTATVTTPLAAGTHTVRATATSSAGGPNLDCLDVDVTPPGSAYQAEDATLSQATVATNHSGYTGTGFVAYNHVTGSYVQFAVDVAATGTVRLDFRYANGSTTNRPMAVAVDGTVVGSAVAFNGTGSWDTWKTVSVTATVPAGAHTVRASATTSNGGPNVDSLTVTTTPVDWSVAMADSTMTRYTPTTLGDWVYTRALYLYGQYLVYQRTHDARYLTYVRSWVDRFVTADGSLTPALNDLDSMLAGRLLVALSRETGDARYQKAAATIVTRLGSYPRTTDGGFWHKTGYTNQLWADGAYMVNPFLAEYGRQFNDTAALDEAAHQLQVYASHLQQPTGVIRHGYDQTKSSSWADKTTGVSPEAWGRADGWFAMALVDVLDALPADHPQRAALVAILRNLAGAIAANQDPVTGRWFEVLDKGSRSDNWTETSCSAMFTYAVSRAVQRGYLDPGYTTVAARGYQGVLTQLSRGGDGLTNLTNTVTGAAPNVYSYYVARTRATNDFHGLGAFLVMNEQLTGTG